MKEKKFSPLLAPNDKIDLDTINYPILASTKLDGVRAVFYKGKILTRSLKSLPNKQLNEKFETLRKYSEDNNLIIDGEIYSHKLNFQEIMSYCMTKDFSDKKIIRKIGYEVTIPEHLKFYCFDCIKDDNFSKPFIERCIDTVPIAKIFEQLIMFVDERKVENKEDVESLFETVTDNGYEGLILRSFDGKYKFGRGTVKEGIIFKVKPFLTFDAKIIDIVQSTEVNDNAEKTTNELGRSVTSKKKDDRHLIEKASAFLVEYEGKPLKVTIAMTDEEKVAVWANRSSYIGKWIQYKGMMVGAKDVPRHPVFERFREDKDE